MLVSKNSEIWYIIHFVFAACGCTSWFEWPSESPKRLFSFGKRRFFPGEEWTSIDCFHFLFYQVEASCGHFSVTTILTVVVAFIVSLVARFMFHSSLCREIPSNTAMCPCVNVIACTCIFFWTKKIIFFYFLFLKLCSWYCHNLYLCQGGVKKGLQKLI